MLVERQQLLDVTIAAVVAAVGLLAATALILIHRRRSCASHEQRCHSDKGRNCYSHVLRPSAKPHLVRQVSSHSHSKQLQPSQAHSPLTLPFSPFLPSAPLRIKQQASQAKPSQAATPDTLPPPSPPVELTELPTYACDQQQQDDAAAVGQGEQTVVAQVHLHNAFVASADDEPASAQEAETRL